MKPNLKAITSIIMAILFVAPLLITMAVPVQAQFTPATIVSVSPSPAYPGEPVTVTIDVAMSATVTVKLCNDTACTATWASTWFTPPTAGRYTVSLTLPESLPGVKSSNGRDYFYVVVTAVGVSQNMQVYIAPKVKVTPIQTTNVDPLGRPMNITVKFLGYVPGDTITTVQFAGPITGLYQVSPPLSVASDGTTAVNITLLSVTGKGLPRGTYSVIGLGTSTNLSGAKNGTLTIVPQVIIKPTEGNGRCDNSFCELTQVNITGYGFDPNVPITKIALWNINFTKVNYTFSGINVNTDSNGYFKVSNLAQYLSTNMTAGLYIPIVYEGIAPAGTLSNTSTIGLGVKGTVNITQSAMTNTFKTRASVTATSFVNGTLGYAVATAAMSFTKTEVLRINITENGMKYMLAANIEGTAIRFSLYNMTTSPPTQLLTTTATPSYNKTLGAYVADLSFTIQKPPMPNATTAPTDFEYKYWATFYNYSNYIYLQLKQLSLSITAANLTITYSNVDTGVTKTWTFTYPTSMSVSGTVVSVPTTTFQDAGLSWNITWSYDASTKIATLTVTGTPIAGPSFSFRNVYYIVRPLLVLLTPGIIKPGDNVTIAAYGYGPGVAYGYVGYNTLDVYWEKIRLLTTISPLGKDGNATFTVTIPTDATFGVHYIWGVDKWGYEYSLAIVIGAKAYWMIVYPPPFTPPAEVQPFVSAGYNNQRIVVCPCPESAGVKGVSYCAKCVTYGGMCDYLGDIVRVVLTGVSPGETITVYFGGQTMKTVIANASMVAVDFVVPTLPEGNYTITVVGSVSGTITVNTFYNYTAMITGVVPQVKPKLLLLDLNKDIVPILVGPGFVRVIGTGFTPGTSMLAMLINGTDAAYSLNQQVQRWSANPSGVLTSPFTTVLGIYMPALEPGAYTISLAYVKPLPNGSTTTGITLPGYVFVVNNVSIATTKDDLAKAVNTLSNTISIASKDIKNSISAAQDALAGQLSTLSDSLKKVSDTVSAMASDVKAVLSKISDVYSAVTTISDVYSAVTTISGKVDSANSKLDKIASDVSDLKSSVSSISTSLSGLQGAVSTIKDAADTLNKNVGALSTKLDSISAAVSDLSGKVSAVSSAVSDLSGKVASKDDVSAVVSKVSDVAFKVDAVSSKVDSAASTLSGKVDSVASKVDSAASTLQTYVIIALILALIAAAASIYAAIQLGRKLAS
jgi:methyl-accepting chemotaxis protein